MAYEYKWNFGNLQPAISYSHGTNHYINLLANKDMLITKIRVFVYSNGYTCSMTFSISEISGKSIYRKEYSEHINGNKHVIIEFDKPIRLIKGITYQFGFYAGTKTTLNASRQSQAVPTLIPEFTFISGAASGVTDMIPMLDVYCETFDYEFLVRDMRKTTLSIPTASLNNLVIDSDIKQIEKLESHNSTCYYIPIYKGIKYKFDIKTMATKCIAGTLDKDPSILLEAETRELMRIIDSRNINTEHLPHTVEFTAQEGEQYFIVQIADENDVVAEVAATGEGDYQLYKYNDVDDTLEEIDSFNIDTEQFLTNGSLTTPSSKVLTTLHYPSVLYWQEKGNYNPRITATVEATPPNQTIISNKIDLTEESIKGIDNVIVDCEGGLLMAVSFDEQQTWKVWNGTEWIDAENDYTGMTKDTVEAITAEQWQLLYEGATSLYIRAAFVSSTQVLKSIYMKFLNIPLSTEEGE